MGQSSSRQHMLVTAPENASDEGFNRHIAYHALARALMEGKGSRRRLPVELVIQIFRYTDYFTPCRELTVMTDIPCHVTVNLPGPASTLWFSTPPFNRRLLSKVARMQLETYSHDQGWCSKPSAGSWSWFELVILSPQGDDDVLSRKKGADGNVLVWHSHSNPIASREFSWVGGFRFESDHDIWKHLEEGDRIGVNVCAQYFGWQNIAREGILKVEEFFEPLIHATS